MVDFLCLQAHGIVSYVVVWLMQQGEQQMGLGAEMYDALKKDEAMPAAVEFEDDDSIDDMQIKGLIVAMTSYERTERPTAEEVLDRLRSFRR